MAVSSALGSARMEFCPKCGMRLTMAVTDKVSLKCPNCGYKATKKSTLPVVAKVDRSSVEAKEPIVIVSEKEAKLKTLPTEKAECPKCGNMLAYVWLVQTRGADESSTQFFRCTRCGETWREYS
ncbi:MAG: transcription factor S [Candidatus Bathyarchaeia archaeon]